MTRGARRSMRWEFLGRVGYSEAQALQLRVQQAVKEGRGEEHLLLLEHPPVFTLGRNAESGDIVADAEWLGRRGVEIHTTDRGGQVTYHGPGQLVGYPILDLSPDRKDIRRYVRDLQAVLVATLFDYGIAAEARPAPEIGVWVSGSKIASLGIHLSRWVTTHGFSLNVDTDLEGFSGIVACGLEEVEMTSMAHHLSRPPSLREVADRIVEHFESAFGRRMVPGVSASGALGSKPAKS